jgi:hypothetical protein
MIDGMLLADSAGRVVERSRALLARHQRLAADLVHVLSECARVRHARPRIIRGGAQAGRDEGLRGQIREWLSEGRLPSPGAETWVGPGSGRRCVVCASAITRTEIEYEIAGRQGDWLCVHLACFMLWKSEAAVLFRRPSADGAAAAD